MMGARDTDPAQGVVPLVSLLPAPWVTGGGRPASGSCTLLSPPEVRASLCLGFLVCKVKAITVATSWDLSEY